MDHVLGQDGQTAHLDSFTVQMMLREAEAVEADVLGELRDFGDFLDHLLPDFRLMSDRAQLAPFFHRRGQGRQDKKHEFHNHLLNERFLIACFELLS